MKKQPTKKLTLKDLQNPSVLTAPHRCPICSGTGNVSNGFYQGTSNYWSSSSLALETCRSCGGRGIVWK